MADVEPAEAVRAFGNRTTVTMTALFPGEWLDRAWRIIPSTGTSRLGG